MVANVEMSNVSDALVIVAKYPQPGQVKTRLGRSIGHRAAAALYRAFLADMAERFGRAARQEGYALCWACAPGGGPLQEIVGCKDYVFAQRGAGFAERLYHIAVDMRAAGCRRLVIISSDSPHLTASLVSDAFAAIEPGQVALGPAEDGGYYLIGLDLVAGAPDLFRGIEMSTPRVLDETLARVAALGFRASLLPPAFDIDELGDLERLAQELRNATTPECSHTQTVLAQLGLITVEEEALHV